MNAELLPYTGAAEFTSNSVSLFDSFIDTMQRAVQFFNANEGFFSFLLSIIAIWVSITAIQSQNKGVMYEKRLSLLSEANRIYTRSKRIVERASSQQLLTQIRLIGIIMFEMKSKEAKIVEDAYGYLKTHKGKELPNNYLAEYADVYMEKYMSNSFLDEAEVVYNKKIYSALKEMYDTYDDLRIGFLALTKGEMDKQILKLSEAVENMEEKKILLKMKSKLPL